jgi:hypothetical protein
MQVALLLLLGNTQNFAFLHTLREDHMTSMNTISRREYSPHLPYLPERRRSHNNSDRFAPETYPELCGIYLNTFSG